MKAQLFLLGFVASCFFSCCCPASDAVRIGQPSIFWHKGEWHTYQNGVWTPYFKPKSEPSIQHETANNHFSQPNGNGSSIIVIRHPSAGMAQPTIGIGENIIAIGPPNITIGQPATGIGQTTMGIGQRNGIGQPNVGIGQTTIGIGQRNGIGQTTIGIGQTTIGIGQPHGMPGPPNLGIGQTTIGIGQAASTLPQSSATISTPNFAPPTATESQNSGYRPAHHRQRD